MKLSAEEKQLRDINYLARLKGTRLAYLLKTYDWGCKTCTSCLEVEKEMYLIMDSDIYNGEEILYLYSLYAPSIEWPMWRKKNYDEKPEM
jgi:hypothetical protein